MSHSLRHRRNGTYTTHSTAQTQLTFNKDVETIKLTRLSTLWLSGREVWGSYPGPAIILLGNNLGQVVY